MIAHKRIVLYTIHKHFKSIMSNSSFSPLTITAIQAAAQAAEILISGFGKNYEIFTKPGRQNYVTEFDTAAENSIISFISQRHPTHRILAEESGLSKQVNNDTILWVIDPLDGTTNFSRRIPLFTISIAAYEGEKILCGVVLQPITQELFVAEHGKGAYLNGVSLAVSKTTKIEESLLVGSLPYDASLSPSFDFQSISYDGAVIRNFGSAALNLAYLAAGKIDGFWMYHLHSWDFAAGQLLIEEAGGRLTLYPRNLTAFHSPADVLASNSLLHPLLESYLL